MTCECGHIQGYHRFRVTGNRAGSPSIRPQHRKGACMVQHCQCAAYREEYIPPHLTSDTPRPVVADLPTLPPLEDTFSPPEPEPSEPAFEAGGGAMGGGGASGSYDDSSSSSSDSGSSSSSDSSSSGDSGGSSGSSD